VTALWPLLLGAGIGVLVILAVTAAPFVYDWWIQVFG
jgi:hypothetical protein